MLRLQSTPRLHWLPTMAAAILFGVAMAAGLWQSGRAGEKDQIETRQAVARDAAVMALSTSTAHPEALDGRRVAVVGRFLDDKTVLHDNQVLQRRAGYHVLTPFRAESGIVLLVNRGWVAPGASRAELPRVRPLAAGTGPMTVEGRIVLPPKRVYEIRPEALQGRVWQNLDLPAMGKQMGLMLQPVVVRLTTPLDDDVTRLPDVLAGGSAGSQGVAAGAGTTSARSAGMTAAKHRGYAFQWFSLAALTVGLFLFFTFIDYGQSSRNA